ncbi:RNA-binding protein squid isoform X1 [Drosophila pseudoobscura]|uniref:RNA-binding protein squid isoform X1 n=1 Tax=Drosophila pseudoobscura pseudoobscura TaxID=46245 RepID=A0A6I8VY02_DROPS|nr:RNA-binding protein squid isoform X1 [Drosophila pseudoobscura]
MADKIVDSEMNGEDFTKDVTTNDVSSENGDAAGAAGSTNGSEHTSAVSNQRDDDRKLFVGGLSWETTEKELRDHFGKFGEIESINVKTDPQTGRSRGFAFIVFTNTEAIDKVSSAGEHIINSKKVDPKKAKARHGKIFVGGLTTEISDEEIKTYFSQFGNIVEVEMPFDKQKSQRKGFCFITFDSEQVVTDLLKTPKQKISGKEVDVKRATPKPENQMMGMRGGARGGMRGGRGGYGRGAYNNQWDGQSSYSGYGGYGGYGAAGGYGDYYAGGYYNGYDYGYDYGYGGGFDGNGYGGGGGGSLGGRGAGGPRGGGGGGGGGGPKGGGGGGGGGSFNGGKQRGSGRQPRHQPY